MVLGYTTQRAEVVRKLGYVVQDFEDDGNPCTTTHYGLQAYDDGVKAKASGEYADVEIAKVETGNDFMYVDCFEAGWKGADLEQVAEVVGCEEGWDVYEETQKEVGDLQRADSEVVGCFECGCTKAMAELHAADEGLALAAVQCCAEL